MYTDKVLAHFKNPSNQGVLDNPSAVGEKGNPVCGDIMKMYIKVGSREKDGQKEEYLEEISFETLGCAAAIAVSSALTDLAKNKSLQEVLALTRQDVIDDLGGLPAPKIHCSMLGIDALHEAVNDYLKKEGKEVKGNDQKEKDCEHEHCCGHEDEHECGCGHEHEE